MSTEAVAVETEIRLDEQGGFNPAAAEPTVSTVLSDGTITRKPAPEPEVTGMKQIHELIENPESEPAEICRLITLEISNISTDLVALRNDPTMSEAWKLKTFSEALKSLSEMRKSIMDTDYLSRQDTLNVDGPKANYLMNTMVGWFVKAMRDYGIADAARNDVLKQYRDISSVEEPNLRRGLREIELGKTGTRRK